MEFDLFSASSFFMCVFNFYFFVFFVHVFHEFANQADNCNDDLSTIIPKPPLLGQLGVV